MPEIYGQRLVLSLNSIFHIYRRHGRETFPYPRPAWARRLVAFLPLKSLPRWMRAPLMWGSASAEVSIMIVVVRARHTKDQRDPQASL
jgi:hypothetical protein